MREDAQYPLQPVRTGHDPWRGLLGTTWRTIDRSVIKTAEDERAVGSRCQAFRERSLVVDDDLRLCECHTWANQPGGESEQSGRQATALLPREVLLHRHSPFSANAIVLWL